MWCDFAASNFSVCGLVAYGSADVAGGGVCGVVALWVFMALRCCGIAPLGCCAINSYGPKQE